MGYAIGTANLTVGLLSIIGGVGALAALPVELEAAAPVAAYSLFKGLSGLGRAKAVINNPGEYQKGDYNLKDAAKDAIDPSGAVGAAGAEVSQLVNELASIFLGAVPQ